MQRSGQLNGTPVLLASCGSLYMCCDAVLSMCMGCHVFAAALRRCFWLEAVIVLVVARFCKKVPCTRFSRQWCAAHVLTASRTTQGLQRCWKRPRALDTASGYQSNHTTHSNQCNADYNSPCLTKGFRKQGRCVHSSYYTHTGFNLSLSTAAATTSTVCSVLS